ncbi:hypothetical protein UA08_00643 [Talaromyces atroroseus]|uniref:alpha-1,2-Mannosidase n=1 Tax=Talaromyces atroroseus TaxID=1441469 RepID=A0A225B9T4_TALAT|nr:hypothetical protein UA08_00643 [Talaromyces atroroseus]OKL63705.1 hypothetical protein UA08_00643 [Talaromyces atroroseus]
MPRSRRYRSFVVFSIIFGLAFVHFLRSREWSDDWPGTKDLQAPPTAINHDSPVSPPEPATEIKFKSGPAGERPSAPEELPLKNKELPKDRETGKQKELVDDETWSTETTYSPTDYSDALDPPSVEESSLKIFGDKPQSEVTEQSGTKKQSDRVGTSNQLPTNTIKQHWEKLPEHFPVNEYDLIKLPTGRPTSLPKLQSTFKDESNTEKLLRTQRLAAIREEFEHAWDGYTEYALGHDEIRPVTGQYRDPFAGWGATLVDALDTLWIMDLKDEFAAAVEEVRKIDFTTSIRRDIPLFETVIRYLGGLLGAYDISGQKYSVLLDKAVELAEILMGAFDTPNRMPVTYYNWAPAAVAQPHRAGTRVVLAELGSLSMEFTRLAQLTMEHKYYDAIARITDELEKMQNNTRLPGMWPLVVDASGCAPLSSSSLEHPTRTEKSGVVINKSSGLGIAKSSPTMVLEKHLPIPKDMEKRDPGLESDAEPADYETGTKATTPLTSIPASKQDCTKQGLASPPRTAFDRFGLGGQSDSTYEYLPKEHMLLGGLSDQYRSLYEISMEPVRDNLIYRPMLPDEERDIRFVATVQVSDNLKDGTGEKNTKYTYEGTHLTCFAGGMFAVGAKLFGLEGDMNIAAKLTDGCVWAYESTNTGIMPEGFEILPCDDPLACPWNATRYMDTMDPHEKSRIIQAEKSYERQLLRAKEAYYGISHETQPSQEKKPNIVSPVRNSVVEESDTIAKRDINPRGLDDYDEHAHLSTSNSKVVQEEASKLLPDVDDPNFVAPPKPTVLSHEDYVAARLQEERIPLGYTKIQSRKYILRPEAIESVFIMYRLTGDNIWREKGWKMFEAIARHCRTELADSAISDVTSKAPELLDEMESFWLAETLKYFYLLFSDPSVVSLDEYVLIGPAGTRRDECAIKWSGFVVVMQDMDLEEVSYDLEDEKQFWAELEEIVSKQCDSHALIDNALRTYLDFGAKFKGEFLVSEYDISCCSYKLFSSSLFAQHADYIRRQIIYSLLQNDGTFQLMNEEGCFPKLLELIRSPGINLDNGAGLHRLLMDLLYEMSRIQKIKIEDLFCVDDDFVKYLFEIIEGVSDDAHDPYHYPVIRVLLVLNEQFMVSAHDPASGLSSSPLTNKVMKVLSVHGNIYKTFGENIILLLNREGETSLQLLTLKLLYLIFTTPSTYEYFYTNDLRVLVDILIRNLLDLPGEAIALRHTYLRVLYPLLAHTQLKNPPHYKCDEIRKTLSILVHSQIEGSDSVCERIMHFAEADETTKRLVSRCSQVEWLRDAGPQLHGTAELQLSEEVMAISISSGMPPATLSESPISQDSDATTSPTRPESEPPSAFSSGDEKSTETLGVHLGSATSSKLSMLEVARQSEIPGIVTPSLKNKASQQPIVSVGKVRPRPQPPNPRRTYPKPHGKGDHDDGRGRPADRTETAPISTDSPGPVGTILQAPETSISRSTSRPRPAVPPPRRSQHPSSTTKSSTKPEPPKTRRWRHGPKPSTEPPLDEGVDETASSPSPQRSSGDSYTINDT